MKKRLFTGLVLLTALFAVIFLLCIINGEFFSTPNVNPMKDYPTIKEMLLDGTLKDNTWYWVDARQGNTLIDVASPAFPLLEGKKAYVVTPEYYIQGNYGYDSAWQAFMFKNIQSTEGEKYILTKRVYLSHWGKEFIPDAQFIKYVDVDKLTPGVHGFRRDAQGAIIPISMTDAAFLRSYYRVYVRIAKDGTRTVRYENIRPIVAQYTLYDYYPSGRMKRRVAIAEVNVLGPQGLPGKPVIDRTGDDRDKYLEYEVRDRKFNDKGQPQTKPGDEVITRLKDKNSPYWLQNILHD